MTVLGAIKKHREKTNKPKLGPVTVPFILATQEAEVEGSLESWSLTPAWSTQQTLSQKQ
jgi:hypothetical protein